MVGRTVTLNMEPYDVVGIAPPRFQFPNGAQAWVPLTLPAAAEARRDLHQLTVLGRLADGGTMDQARAELAVVARGLAAGAVLAFVTGRLLSSALRGAMPADPVLVVKTTVALALAALIAAWIPSRRAMSVEPATALRAE